MKISEGAMSDVIVRDPEILGGRVKTIQGRAAFRLWQIANRSRNTADSFRDIDTMVFSAVMDYRPKPYDGRVIYFERGDN